MKNCQWCDATFETDISYKIYCSPECREAATKNKIAEKYAQKRRAKMMGKKRNCKTCDSPLSAYNDDQICHACSVNPKDVAKALKEIKDIASGKAKSDS
jgi:methylphosphotriester-DNA--protein-cysteine methyltransferase